MWELPWVNIPSSSILWSPDQPSQSPVLLPPTQGPGPSSLASNPGIVPQPFPVSSPCTISTLLGTPSPFPCPPSRLDLHCALSPAPGLGRRNVSKPVEPVVGTPLCSRGVHSGQLPGEMQRVPREPLLGRRLWTTTPSVPRGLGPPVSGSGFAIPPGTCSSWAHRSQGGGDLCGAFGGSLSGRPCGSPGDWENFVPTPCLIVKLLCSLVLRGQALPREVNSVLAHRPLGMSSGSYASAFTSACPWWTEMNPDL